MVLNDVSHVHAPHGPKDARPGRGFGEFRYMSIRVII